jgi:adenylate cyclase
MCGSAFRVGGSGSEPGFDELRELCIAAGDDRSLAIGMAGLVVAQYSNARRREASRLATELVGLLDTSGDPTLTVALSFAALLAKHETAEMAEVLRLALRVIDLADGDPTRGNLIIGSPLASATTFRGIARCCLGIAGWNHEFRRAATMARAVDPLTLAGVVNYSYVLAIPNAVLLPDATALRDTADALAIAEQSGDNIALNLARFVRGIALVHRGGPGRERGLELLAQVRETALQDRFSLTALPLLDIHVAMENARLGDVDGAVELSRAVVDNLFDSGRSFWSALASAVLVEALLDRGGDADVQEAQAAVDQLAAVPTDPGFVLHEIWLLRSRALLARAQGDDTAYRDYRDRYRAMATSLGFEGHMKWAEAMP